MQINKKIQWINDPANNQFLHYDLPLEYNKTLHWFQGIQDREDRYDAVILADGIPVGLIGLLGMDAKNRKAEAYVVVGEASCKGKHVATKAFFELLSYGFNELGLNRVYLYTERDNVAAQRLFERVGFVKEGLLRDDLLFNGRKVDRYVYGITAAEFVSVTDSNTPSDNQGK